MAKSNGLVPIKMFLQGWELGYELD